MNKWLWFHAVGSVYLTKLFIKLGLSKRASFYLLVGVAILWEVVEFIFMDITIYGSTKAFLLDSVQDIGIAVLCSLGVII